LKNENEKLKREIIELKFQNTKELQEEIKKTLDLSKQLQSYTDENTKLNKCIVDLEVALERSKEKRIATESEIHVYKNQYKEIEVYIFYLIYDFISYDI
jgi:CRISPR/Cas system CSM-associated protein Csm4 (group 5 of RAMP superfamily)